MLTLPSGYPKRVGRLASTLLVLMAVWTSSIGLLQAQLCAPAYGNECDSDDYIDNFTFHTLSNLATGCNSIGLPGPPYENFTLFPASGATTTTVTKGQTYTMTMQAGSLFGQGFAVWIDYNNNNSFADPGENVYISPTSTTALLTTSVTIPSGAASAQVRMRVRCAYGFSTNPLTAADFCSQQSFGETEDYIITIIPPSSKDIGLSNILVSPGGCFGPNQTVTVRLTNAGLDTLRFATDRVRITGSVSGAGTATFGPDSVVTGTLAPGATLDKVMSSNFNMSGAGTYAFSFSVTMPGDGASANNSASRNVDVTAPIPYGYTQNFNTGTTIPPEIQTTQFFVSGTHGRNSTNGLSYNVYFSSFGTTNVAQWQVFKTGPIPPNGILNLDYRFTNWSGFGTATETPTSFTPGDSVNIFISTNCGQSYQLVQSYNSTTHSPNASWQTFSLNLAPYAGQQLILRVVASVPTTSLTDFYADFDNLEFTVPSPDAQVTTIQPNGNQCNQGGKKPIILGIRNNGNVALSNIPLVVNVTGRPTINTTFPVTNFPPGAVSNYELTDSIDVSLSQLYTIRAHTNLAGDVNVGNDTSVANITAGFTPPQPTGVGDSICPGNTLTLTASGSGTITWYGSATSIVPITTGTSYTTPVLSQTTTYYVSTSSPTCGESPRSALVAFVRPAASVAAPNDTTICVGNVLNLAAGNVNGTVTWSLSPTGSPATFTGTVFQVQPSITTKYFVRASNSCGTSGVDSVLVTVNNAPAPAAPTVPGASTCPGQDVTLNATGTTAPVSWFSAPTGGTALATGSSYTVVNPQQTDTLYAQAIGACSSSTRTPVVVTVTTPGAVDAPANVSICVGQQVDLQPLSSNGPLEWYEATSTGAPFATTNTVTVQPSISTTYFVRATGPCGASAFDSVRVTVVVPAVPSVQGDDSICAGQVFSLLAGGASAFLWYDQAQGGAPIATTPVFALANYTQTDTFYVESVEGNCTSARVARVLFVDRELSDLDILGADTTDEGNSITYTIQNPDPTSTYRWTVTGGTPTTGTGTSLSIAWAAAGRGLIEVVESRPLGCSDTTTVEVQVRALTATGLLAGLSTLSVYPNPANEQVYLNLTSPRVQTVNIRLLDATGRLVRWVYTGQDVQALQLPIAVGDLADGLYLLEVRTDSGLQTARVLVRH